MNPEFTFYSLSSIILAAEKSGRTISSLVLSEQAEEFQKTEEEIFSRMEKQYRVMEECIEPGTKETIRSTSGLTGGDAFKMRKMSESGKSLTGPVLSGALYRALAVSELNASMGRIVAAPTAGSCGILPAAVLTMQTEKNISRRDCVLSLFTASAVGMVISNNASLAGSEGGCQAECGSAAAMAAAAVTELSGGTPRMIGNAVAIAIKNILGLVCDPVAGLVEIPCIKRNASGVAGAFVAAELALAGIESAIPADETILAMKKVGNMMSSALRETAEGGLAATPTGKKLYEKVFGTVKT
jgi:L-serine dehydratase